MSKQKELPTIKDIIQAVSVHTGVPISVIMNASKRTAQISRARHLICFLACKGAFMSLEEVGKGLGFSSATPGTPVRYGVKKIENAWRSPKARVEIHNLAEQLGVKIK